MNIVGIPYRNHEDFLKIRQQLLSVYESITPKPETENNHIQHLFDPKLYAMVERQPEHKPQTHSYSQRWNYVASF
jgi:hypothetical protein